jgi:hypothetical protein
MAVKRYDGTAWQVVAGKGDQGTSSSISTWVKTASGGETSLSGNDDNSQALSYTIGQELVFINGTLLKRGSDYTATNGTSITGLTALAANDVATVWTVNAFSVTGAIANTIVDAKGDLLVGTAADTPGRLAVGTNDYVLTADSTTGTGLKWAAPAGGGKVAQVVSTTKTSSFSTNSGTYTDVTDLSVSITPTLNTSKIMVFVDVQVVGDTGVGSAFWQLVRGATAIAIGDTEGSRRRSTGQAYSADNNTAFSGSINYLDAPATTSATTYKVQILADGGGSAFVNRSEGFGDNTAHAVNASSITVMEILA